MQQNYYYHEIRTISSKIRGLAFLIKVSKGNRTEQIDLNDVCYGLGSLLSEQVDALTAIADQIEADDLMRYRLQKSPLKK